MAEQVNAFSVDGLVDAATGHDELRGTAAGIAAVVPRLTVGAGSLGTVDAAAGFVSGLGQVAGGFGRLATREVDVREGQSQATSATARLGELLKSDLADMAGAATPPPLSTPGAILEQPWR